MELNKSEVVLRLHIANRTLELWCKTGYFPKPIYIGRRAFWRLDVVELWIERKFVSQGCDA